MFRFAATAATAVTWSLCFVAIAVLLHGEGASGPLELFVALLLSGFSTVVIFVTVDLVLYTIFS